MPQETKCPHCPRRYALAGAFNTHLARCHQDIEYEPSKDSDLLNSLDSGANLDSDSDLESIEDSGEPETDGDSAYPPEYWPASGASLGEVPGYEDHPWDDWNPWSPFADAEEWQLARWFIESNTPKQKINDFFNAGLGKQSHSRRTFQSAHPLDQHLDRMLGSESLPPWQHGSVSGEQGGTIHFYYRNILTCAQYLMRQRCYAPHMVYAPVKEFDGDGNRLYSELYTADWWWNIQSQLPPGATLVPIICGSDATHLTNFSGDKKAWPIYMTIGNLLRRVRNSSRYRAQICVALLPIPPKFKGNAAAQDRQCSWNCEVLYQVMRTIMDPLRGIDATHSITMHSSDGKIRECWPVLAAWLADHVEHCNLQNVKHNWCPKCEIPKEDLGTYIKDPGSTYYRTQDAYEAKMDEYDRLQQMLGPTNPTSSTSNSNTRGIRDQIATIEGWFEQRGLRSARNPFWGLPFVNASDLHMPDMLHVVYLGILKHLMDWLSPFLQEFGRLNDFDAIWKSIPTYPGFTPPRKAYQEVTQWQGKEMRNFGRIVLPALAGALRNPGNDAQRQIFSQALRCIKALVGWVLMAQYPSHTNETIAFMDEYIEQFHAHKGVFLKYQGGRTSDILAAHVRQTVKEQHEAEIRSTQGMTQTKRRRLQANQRLELDEAVAEAYREHSHFNFPKMHLLSHFSKQICKYGGISQYSTEAGETAHKDQIKEPYRRTNRVDATLQILAGYNREYGLAMRQQNLIQLAREGHCTTEMAEVLHLLPPETNRLVSACRRKDQDPWDSPNATASAAIHPQFPDTVEPLSTRRRVASERETVPVCEFVLPGARLPLEAYLVQYYRREFGHPRGVPNIGLWKVTAFNALHVPVHRLGLGDESVVHILRATEGESFRGREARNDWAWCKFGPEDQYGALRGRRPARVIRFLKLQDPTQRPLLLAVMQPLRPDSGGHVDPIHGIVRVSCPSANDETWIINIKSITGMAHLVPESPRPENTHWFVNNTIDLDTFNEIY